MKLEPQTEFQALMFLQCSIRYLLAESDLYPSWDPDEDPPPHSRARAIADAALILDALREFIMAESVLRSRLQETEFLEADPA